MVDSDPELCADGGVGRRGRPEDVVVVAAAGGGVADVPGGGDAPPLRRRHLQGVPAEQRVRGAGRRRPADRLRAGTQPIWCRPRVPRDGVRGAAAVCDQQVAVTSLNRRMSTVVVSFSAVANPSPALCASTCYNCVLEGPPIYIAADVTVYRVRYVPAALTLSVTRRFAGLSYF
ncbi:uncharacterized protein LOC124799179 [Schistocerca piceifrons]|uniref:uncharacterized protein LOC124799179 n=1 Tax=Schistocerca piceifrons TaxID=274613 RepID=UPI001F5EA14B|nr:uncharacterized protein LOC124799179 [Schistocerca piceifrons]